MDPVSQAALGSAAAQSINKKHIAIGAILGALSGMAPDLDVLIRSSEDPLLFLDYHRHFTHSLFFIPIGALICALALHPLFSKKRGLSFKQSYLFCMAGYATHALLDACTTYGTLLMWPFTDTRFAWNTISVIDPLFTLPVLLLVIVSAIKKWPLLARFALAWAVIYPTIGMVQRDRAMAEGYELATSRGHTPTRLEAKPSFGNIVVWKIVYEHNNRFYVGAVRTGVETKLFEGDSVAKLNTTKDLPWLDLSTQQAIDVERFRWFSNDYLALDPNDANRVIDVRYSMIPNRIDPLWSIELSPSADDTAHVQYLTHRNSTPETTAIFKAMLFD